MTTTNHHEATHHQPRPLLTKVLTAARQGAPWLVALIGLTKLAVLITVLVLLTQHTPATPPPTPATRLQENR